jgi:hypothetical protein
VRGVNGYLNAHRAVGQPAQALQMLPQSVPQEVTTAYYLQAQEQQAIRNFRQRSK